MSSRIINWLTFKGLKHLVKNLKKIMLNRPLLHRRRKKTTSRLKTTSLCLKNRW